jgi:Domain of unknown function (DUF6766)
VRFLRDNSLSIFFLFIFLAALGGQALVGHGEFNHDQLLHHGDPISLGRYLTSSQFAVDVAENWQSEYLQFTLYILGTVWLIQRGSPESKPPGQVGLESDEEQKIGRHAEAGSPKWAKVGGLRTRIFSTSLVIVMTALWLGSWFAQSIAGWSAYNADQIDHQARTLSWLGYIGTNDFWDRTLQNWQSEFLAVGSMAILSVYLRQRGSPESKPVGAPHEATGVEG